ncbi:hypothetical protein IW261DRAFT_1293832, partial [Armillaria novae-zelandiae]
VERLAESALSTLVNTFSLSGNSPQTRQQIPPQQKPSIPTLDFVPSTEQECTLATIIQRLEMENELLRRRAIELQAANVLNEAYCAVLQEQLAFKEEKGKKKTASGRLMGDGMPVLLTGDDFYERVVQWEKSQEEAAAAKTNRKAAKVMRDSRLADWIKKCDERTAEIKRIEERWEKAKEEWNEEKEKWKRDKTAGLNVPAHVAKLKPKQGPLPKAIPRPTIKRQSPTANKPSSESLEQFDGYSSSNGDSAD